MIERDLEGAATASYGLLVIGGGMYGAALALEASRRGVATLLLERGGFGGETTRSSLRILHGGLRYLQRLDLPRFRESVGERRWFLRHFPDLVEPLPCLMPLHDPPRGGRLRRRGIFRLALGINDLLARERALPPGRLLSVAETVELFPGVDRAGLRGGALWYDAVTKDPERLTREVLRWACRCGARALSQVEAVELIVQDRKVAGVLALDRTSGRSLEFRAPRVVNCAGPWSRDLARRFDRDVPALLRPALAFNLLLDREPPSRTALAVASREPGARTWFLLPWEGRLLAGTDYAPVPPGRSGEEGPDEARIGELLAALNAALPGFGLRRGEVRGVLWGRLPAVAEGSVELASRPVIVDHGRHGGPRGLVSVSGVKLTTARAVARRTLKVLGAAPRPAEEAGGFAREGLADPDVETASEGYASRFEGEVGRWFVGVQAAVVLEMLAPYPGARVLDVGGGHGQLAVPLVEYGFDVTVAGSDEVCRERLDRLLPRDRFAFRACDLACLPFADRSFDVVAAFRLLPHVKRWRELVRELCRVADRAVILDYPDARSFNVLYGPLFRLKKAIEGNTRTFLIFRPGQVAAELARHGFGRPEIRRQFFVPMVVHRAMGWAGLSRGVERVSGACGLIRAFGSPAVLRAERKEGS